MLAKLSAVMDIKGGQMKRELEEVAHKAHDSQMTELRGQPFYSCKRICVRKKNPAQDHPPKQNSRTYSGLEKKFRQDAPCADTLNFCISKLLKDLSIWTWVFL